MNKINNPFLIKPNLEAIYNNDDGKLIFVSDLEGCAKVGANGKTPQSTVVCSDDFFKKLDSFLSLNKNNKVAFLGDYFDKGIDFESTINHIIKLYEKYNFKQNITSNKKKNIQNSFNKRVYIILGNRDLNKLRLLFEYIPSNSNNPFKAKEGSKSVLVKGPNNLVKNSNSYINNIFQNLNEKKETNYKLWYEWRKFYKLYLKNINKDDFSSLSNTSERFKIILEDSMGAKQLDEEKMTAEVKYIMLEEYYKTILDLVQKNNNYHTRVKYNFWKLYEYGRIADYDSDFKVLLSHSGGMGNFLFHSSQYYDNIISKLSDVNGNMITYFENIEIVRKELMKPPVGLNVFFRNNNENSSKNIKEVISIINSPLIKFMKDISINNPYFYLLQALGLKPDNMATDYFVSFVQSCDCVFCKGPRANNFNPIKNGVASKNMYNSNTYLKFLESLKKLNVKFVSFGHNPHCTPVPIIYRRSDDVTEDQIIFIGNDVSNGYRPVNIESIYQIPLAYISRKPDEVGVGFLKSTSNISSNLNESLLMPESLKKFKAMIGKWNYNNVPLFNLSTKKVHYNSPNSNKKILLSFPARLETGFGVYRPAIMESFASS
jgi:hypothetical protein